MAHFAQINKENIVLQVVVIDNNDITENGVESEAKGIAYCQQLFGAETDWRQTSYNGTFRKKYAQIGDRYDPDLDAFITPQPYPSWRLNTETCRWEAPKPMPSTGVYTWDEGLLRWVSLS